MRLFIFVLAIIAAGTQAQNSNWVERKEVDTIQRALTQYYNDCGFFPDSLETLFDINDAKTGCVQSQKKKRTPPLADNPANRDAVARLMYTPHGYQDYDLAMRLYWTKD